jgi:hypothetical protein
LSEDSTKNSTYIDGELSPEDLLIQANCNIDEMEYRHTVLPSINFFLEISKIILDSLRQNSKMLEFYNTTAIKCFEFCSKFNCKREYYKISETIHSHFNQILK